RHMSPTPTAARGHASETSTVAPPARPPPRPGRIIPLTGLSDSLRWNPTGPWRRGRLLCRTLLGYDGAAMTGESMDARTCLAIVLAAGEGTRMRSSRPKVLHVVAGRSLLAHVLQALRGAGSGETAVVVGPDREDVAAEARAQMPGAE